MFLKKQIAYRAVSLHNDAKYRKNPVYIFLHIQLYILVYVLYVYRYIRYL